MEDPSLFVLSALTILGMPGPTNALFATAGATTGWRRSWLLVVVAACGYLTTIMLLGFVLGPVLAKSPVVALLLRAAVGIYLSMLAWKLWDQGSSVQTKTKAVTFLQFYLATVLNPKGIILALGIIPFGKPHVWTYLLGFAGLVVVVGTCWLILGEAAGRMATAAGKGRWVPRIGATVVGIFAVVIVAAPLLN